MWHTCGTIEIRPKGTLASTLVSKSKMNKKTNNGYTFKRVWTGKREVTTYRYFSKGKVYKTYVRVR